MIRLPFGNPGTHDSRGVSNPRRPFSINWSTATAVMDLDTDASRKGASSEVV